MLAPESRDYGDKIVITLRYLRVYGLAYLRILVFVVDGKENMHDRLYL